jgi:hypothetical protein
MSKKKVKEAEEEKRLSEYWTHLHGFNEGYQKAILDMSWECFDCGNTYEPSVDACPNELLDQANASVRYSNYHKENDV